MEEMRMNDEAKGKPAEIEKPLILVDRTNIGIFGRTNAGKSTIMNLITSQQTSIVDAKPGTTADVVQTVMEIHDFGPVKLFDTAGLDERSLLGEKKRHKTLQALKECDLVLLVVDPSDIDAHGGFSVENEVASLCRKYEKQLVLVYNVFSSKTGGIEQLEGQLKVCRGGIGSANSTPSLALDAHAEGAAEKLVAFIRGNYVKRERQRELLPLVAPYSFVAMNIPIDEETPAGRLLRPQNAVLDYLLRRMVPFAGYRMDLKQARSQSEPVRQQEKQRYLDFLSGLSRGPCGLQLVITDSQAIDVVDAWTPPEIPLTTFSITMINSQSNGNLVRFVQGLDAISKLRDGDRIAIAEACNHNRMCDDIGTKQIPRRLKEKLGINLEIDFIFGREFPPEAELGKYKLVVHCGGCMADTQKVGARMEDLLLTRVPVTNYGLLLSYLNGEKTLRRVLAPWGL